MSRLSVSRPASWRPGSWSFGARRRARCLAALAPLLALSPAPAGARQESTTSSAEAAEVVAGRLVHGDQPVAGVLIRVRQGAAPVAEVATGADGTWRVDLPGPGRYQVALDTRTLPKGTRLTDPRRATLDVEVFPGEHKSLLFPLGARPVGGPSRLARLADLAAVGIKIGLIVAMASIGLSLIYGVTGLVNFAHGELVTFGALVAFLLNAAGGGPRWQLVPSAVVGVGAGALLGLVLELSLFRPLRRRRSGTVSLIVVTIGLSLLARHVFLILIGGLPRPYTDYTVQQNLDLGPVAVPPKDVVVSLVALVVLIGVGVMVQATRTGTAMRAVSDNPALARASGIDVERVILVTWVVGSALAALGGILFAVSEQVAWDMGFKLLLFMFAAVVVGGLGSAYGAMLGGLLVGVAAQFSTYWLPSDFKDVVALGALVLVLLVRPQGILGVAERVG